MIGLLGYWTEVKSARLCLSWATSFRECGSSFHQWKQDSKYLLRPTYSTCTYRL